MFAKDAPLASEVNKIISDLKKEGFIAGLHEKWFGAKAEDTTSTVQERDMPKAAQ
jgi:polar amino acid transport system substrate-binding protein